MKARSRASTASGVSSCSNKIGSSVFTNCDLMHTTAQRIQRRLKFRFHSAAHVLDPLFDRVRVQLRDDVAVRVEKAGDVGDELQRARTQRDRECGRGAVGVHVEEWKWGRRPTDA